MSGKPYGFQVNLALYDHHPTSGFELGAAGIIGHSDINAADGREDGLL